MERNHSTPFSGRPRTKAELLGDDVKPGDFEVAADGDSILIVCPCGCTGLMRLPIYAPGISKVKTPSWGWNGSRDKPTLTPSILDLGGCRFHGFLNDGVWTFTSDSGQEGR